MQHRSDLGKKLDAVASANDADFVQLVQMAGLNPSIHFQESNLKNADFENCDLAGFDFRGAKLSGASFEGASILNTQFDADQLGLEELKSAMDYFAFRASRFVSHRSQNSQIHGTRPSLSDLPKNIEYIGAPVILSNKSLSQLPDHMIKPKYDRSKLKAGIVHIGVGNFHRAHQAWYLHRLMQKGCAFDWAIVGAGVKSGDEQPRERLLKQDCLSTLISLDQEGASIEVVGSIIDYLPLETGHRALVKAMAEPSIRIVSLTITEGGYYLDAETGKLDLSNPDIQFDVANPELPRTAFGAILAALRIRRKAGLKPFTCLSCDNLPRNGDVLRQVMLSLAQLMDHDLAGWIGKHMTFPNSLVDCIVPRSGRKERELGQAMGVVDQAVVTHEPYRKWVIEDRFCDGRPDLEKVGVEFVESINAYEDQKLRFLNGGHQIIANVGELLSMVTVPDCMNDPDIVRFFRKVLSSEIEATVDDVLGTPTATSIKLVEWRFSNIYVRDTVRRIAFDGYSRHAGFILPIIQSAISNGTQIDGLCLAEAFWAKMCAGVRDDGSRIEPNDPRWDHLQEVAQDAKVTPSNWVKHIEIYGDLAENEEFVEHFEKWLRFIWENGSRAALHKYLKATPE